MASELVAVHARFAVVIGSATAAKHRIARGALRNERGDCVLSGSDLIGWKLTKREWGAIAQG